MVMASRFLLVRVGAAGTACYQISRRARPQISEKRSRALGHRLAPGQAAGVLAGGRPRTHFYVMGWRVISLLLGAIALAGCATGPTPYRPYDGATGYAEQQIDADTWRVRFAGNFETPREAVENYLLYRAAEIMRFGGVDRFVVLDRQIERTVTYRGIGPYAPYDYGFHRHRFFDDDFGHRVGYHGGVGDYYALSRYTGYATVRRFTGGPAPSGFPVYDARQVIETLGPTIVLPRDSAG